MDSKKIDKETVDTVVSEISKESCPDGEKSCTRTRECVAQVGVPSVTKEVSALGDCCRDLVQNVDPIVMKMKKIRATIIRGQVLCSDENGSGVEGVIVVARRENNNKNYVGITDEYGNYSICVPPKCSYTISAYCCGNCEGDGSGDICRDVDCECGCKGNNQPS